VPDDFYGRLAKRARACGAKLIVDTHGAALRAAAAERPYLIRLNHLEAQELLGGTTDVAAHALGRQLVDAGLCEGAIVTIGSGGAIVTSADGQIEIRPPHVEVRSSVGAGDSFVAALTFGLANGWPLPEAARYGVAAAAAAVTTEATQLCQRETVEAFYTQIGGTLRSAA
jgi:6-phosphofructokinase 2